MAKNDIEFDDEIDFDDEDNEANEMAFVDKKLLSNNKMDFKRKLEEYLENKKLEEELYNY
jgi:predicted HicB family RNase H-like nuclease